MRTKLEMYLLRLFEGEDVCGVQKRRVVIKDNNTWITSIIDSYPLSLTNGIFSMKSHSIYEVGHYINRHRVKRGIYL